MQRPVTPLPMVLIDDLLTDALEEALFLAFRQ